MHTRKFQRNERNLQLDRDQEINQTPFTSKEILSKYSDGKDLVVALNAQQAHGMLAESRVWAELLSTLPPHTLPSKKGFSVNTY